LTRPAAGAVATERSAHGDVVEEDSAGPVGVGCAQREGDAVYARERRVRPDDLRPLARHGIDVRAGAERVAGIEQPEVGLESGGGARGHVHPAYERVGAAAEVLRAAVRVVAGHAEVLPAVAPQRALEGEGARAVRVLGRGLRQPANGTPVRS